MQQPELQVGCKLIPTEKRQIFVKISTITSFACADIEIQIDDIPVLKL